jgi:LuxR family maltose regulon positive regulatory protein
MGRLIENLVLQAIAFEAIDEHDLALAALEKALTLAEPEGYVRIFVDEGAAMQFLLAKMKFETGRLNDYASRLLTAFLQQPAEVQLHPSSLSPQPLVEPLSDRELDVLHLLSQGFSNTEIADRLVLSVGTVKSHAHHIYGKLGVQSRTQAIIRAKELNLL